MTEESGILGVFATHPFLGDLRPQHRMILASGVRPFSAAPGELLAHDGKPASAFFLIQSGNVAVEKTLPSKKVVTLQTLGAGDIVGWSWIVSPHFWQFDCRACDQVKGLSFDAHWLRHKCEEDHELGYQIMQKLLTIVAARLSATFVKMQAE